MLTVQQATIENVDIIAPIFDAYRQFYQQPAALQQAHAFIKDRLEHNESVIFLASWQNQPAGFTQLYPLFSSISLRRTWVLNDLYVLSEFRQKGIATALLEAAKAYVKNTGARGLTLETGTTNRSAQALYEKNGWKREENFFYGFTFEVA